MLDNLDQTIDNCRFCLMCRHVAPVGHITDREALTPHGVALTISAQRRGLIEWNPETVAVIFSEVDGGNSRAHCVFDQPFEAAIAHTRAELVEQGLAPAVVEQMRTRFEHYETVFATHEPQPATGVGDYALFVGDEAAHLWAGALPAVLKLLAAGGIEPVQIGSGRNSGFLAQSLGLPAPARLLAEKTQVEVAASGAKTLLTLSAGDYFTFRQLTEERLGLTPLPDLEIVEVTALLATLQTTGRLLLGQVAEDRPYAYIDPTHAVRNPGRHKPVRELIATVMPTQARELFWRKERAHPVGSTHLQFSNPALADQLTHARLQDAKQSGAQLLICEDPATLHQLRRFAGAYGLDVQGLYELLATALL